MEQNNNYSKVNEIAATHLGKVGGEGYKDQYDPSLLVKIPRKLNRQAYEIEDKKLPFVGYDVWNAYEVSALTKNGLPVSGMLKIIYPANSKYHVESKSIKLYLNSFNMSVFGHNTREVTNEIQNRVARDLSTLLETKVDVRMFTNLDCGDQSSLFGYSDLSEFVDLETLKFNNYKSDHTLLKSLDANSNSIVQNTNSTLYTYRIKSDLLRSNCRVTNQPDWGDIFIHMTIDRDITPDIDLQSIAHYIVSHRKVNHFHEEIAEMVYQHFTWAYNPVELMVACLYTRRGGIDINPVRASSDLLIPNVFSSLDVRLSKTLRQ